MVENPCLADTTVTKRVLIDSVITRWLDGWFDGCTMLGLVRYLACRGLPLGAKGR